MNYNPILQAVHFVLNFQFKQCSSQSFLPVMAHSKPSAVVVEDHNSHPISEIDDRGWGDAEVICNWHDWGCIAVVTEAI